VTAFVSLMTFDFIRAEENRVDCFPCIRVRSLATELEHGMHAAQCSGSSDCFNVKNKDQIDTN
jgi:hypothetical protein